MNLFVIPEPPGLQLVIERVAFIKARFRSCASSFVEVMRSVSAQPSSPRIAQAISHAATRYALDPALLTALAQVESGLRTRAVSPEGAMGITQLMPATARRLGVIDPFDLEANLDGGARYLREQLDRFAGDLSLALAAYNAGPGAVLRYGGMPPYAETRRFVSRVLDLAGQIARARR